MGSFSLFFAKNIGLQTPIFYLFMFQNPYICVECFVYLWLSLIQPGKGRFILTYMSRDYLDDMLS